MPKGATACGGAVERSETEGEHLAALGSFEPFPFRLLIAFAATFPVNGDSFWVRYKLGVQCRTPLPHTHYFRADIFYKRAVVLCYQHGGAVLLYQLLKLYAA